MYLVEFLGSITAKHYKQKFLVLALEVRDFLETFIERDAQSAKKIYEIMKIWGYNHTRAFDYPMLARSSEPVLKKIGIKEILQILHEFLYVRPLRHKYK